MTAGKRDELITFQRATTAADGYGEAIETWVSVAQAWAEVFYGTGSERRVAAAEQGQQTATFVVLDNSATRQITVMDRIAFNGLAWDIEGVVSGKRGYIEVSAVAGEPTEIGEIEALPPVVPPSIADLPPLPGA